jgi:endonuclease/exonuclease/phosphatase family metal-dependent hydrolase
VDIIELLDFKRKPILVGDLNAKHPFWNSSVSNPSGEELLELFHKSEFEISTPQCPTHYSPAGNGDIRDIVVHQNFRMSDVTVSDILDSDHLPVIRVYWIASR